MEARVARSRSSRREPLSDAQDRLNVPSSGQFSDCLKVPRPSNRATTSSNSVQSRPDSQTRHVRESSHTSHASHASQYQSAVASHDSYETVEDSRRFSKASKSSTNSGGYKKTHIGPWQLGKTLGKGASARVRAARHCVTHQPVAVKIVAKKTSQITQARSLANIDAIDRQRMDPSAERHMPLAIEREVAILKLIEHPNIMKLYDIWENRDEMYASLPCIYLCHADE